MYLDVSGSASNKGLLGGFSVLTIGCFRVTIKFCFSSIRFETASYEGAGYAADCLVVRKRGLALTFFFVGGGACTSFGTIDGFERSKLVFVTFAYRLESGM